MKGIYVSGRCKCCNDVMEDFEMVAIDPLTGTYTELCTNCLSEDVFDVLEEIPLEYVKEEDLL